MTECRATPRILGTAAVLATLAVSSASYGQRAWRTPGQEEAARGRELAALGRCAEAIQYFDRAIVLRKGDASLRLERARCHEQLGSTRPALEDYRAFLSASPDAPDADAARQRLDALGEEAKAEKRSRDEPESAPIEPAQLDPEAEPDAPRSRLARRGGLLGLHLGYRDWNDAVAGQTFSVGLEGGWIYRPGSELTLRVTRLDTNELDTDGYGISAAHGWSFSFTERLGVLLAAGGGFETQRNQFRVRRNYFFGRASPSLRFAVMNAVMLQGGPEFGLGSMPASSNLVADTTPGAQDTHLALYWGGRAELLWVIGG